MMKLDLCQDVGSEQGFSPTEHTKGHVYVEGEKRVTDWSM